MDERERVGERDVRRSDRLGWLHWLAARGEGGGERERQSAERDGATHEISLGRGRAQLR